jgi:hypothetical protein
MERERMKRRGQEREKKKGSENEREGYWRIGK